MNLSNFLPFKKTFQRLHKQRPPKFAAGTHKPA